MICLQNDAKSTVDLNHVPRFYIASRFHQANTQPIKLTTLIVVYIVLIYKLGLLLVGYLLSLLVVHFYLIVMAYDGYSWYIYPTVIHSWLFILTSGWAIYGHY